MQYDQSLFWSTPQQQTTQQTTQTYSGQSNSGSGGGVTTGQATATTTSSNQTPSAAATAAYNQQYATYYAAQQQAQLQQQQHAQAFQQQQQAAAQRGRAPSNYATTTTTTTAGQAQSNNLQVPIYSGRTSGGAHSPQTSDALAATAQSRPSASFLPAPHARQSQSVSPNPYKPTLGTPPAPDKDKNNNKDGSSSSSAYNYDECPLYRDQLGRAAWAYLHQMAANYPVTPSEQEKTAMLQFIYSFAQFFPCRTCSTDFSAQIRQYPPQVNSQADLTRWFCQQHNMVNSKLGKPQFDCSRVNERWKHSESKNPNCNRYA